MHNDHDPKDQREHLYETTDAKAKPILYYGIALLLLTLVSLVLMWFFYAALDKYETSQDTPSFFVKDERWQAPDIQLETHPSKERQEYAKEQEELQSSYGWIDPANEIVRVPVERAVEIALEKGFPVRETFPAGTTLAVPEESGGFKPDDGHR